MSSRTQRVLRAINELSQEPFRYGVCDCARFAWRIGKVAIGRVPEFPLVYADEREALLLLSQRPLLERVCDLLGEPVSVLDTEDGDPLYVDRLGGLLAVRLSDSLVCKTSHGVRCTDVRVASFGWRLT